ncbi:SAM-dependent methyltransferase [Actinosynnema sp.]|uniref:SAM-dependent methyltransferase n=1 Tax=Actinosynnema sp. TaxID=1872144 RepID=UPI003F8755ED
MLPGGWFAAGTRVSALVPRPSALDAGAVDAGAVDPIRRGGAVLSSPTGNVLRNDYERKVNAHWEDKRDDPVNLLLGADDGLYHHHYGIDAPDPDALTGPPHGLQRRIARELHRMESAQADLVLSALGEVPASARILDAGSGRGGTSFMAHDRFGCAVDGVNFCSHHVELASDLARRRGCADRVRFHRANLVATPFADGAFDRVIANESTMYVDLDEAFAEFARLLRPGGRHVLVTGCHNDAVTGRAPEGEAIDRHYDCRIHRRSTYFRALADHGLAPLEVTDLTARAIPYWELRARSDLRTGVETAFLDGYRSGRVNYLLVVAERVVDR